MLPLFSVGSQKSGNEHKMELFPKDLNVKCSSSYRQCFIATEHNEETRTLREKIESYKIELKGRRSAREKQMEEKLRLGLKVNNEITYERMAESGMSGAIREIVLVLLGS